MTALESLKKELHHRIDVINDKEKLVNLYKQSLLVDKNDPLDFWDELTEEEKEETKISLKEIEDENATVENDVVLEQFKKWFTK
jgi:hypothetical protein